MTMTCSTKDCTRAPRPTFRICDACLTRALYGEPVWVQRAHARRLPAKDYTALVLAA